MMSKELFAILWKLVEPPVVVEDPIKRRRVTMSLALQLLLTLLFAIRDILTIAGYSVLLLPGISIAFLASYIGGRKLNPKFSTFTALLLISLISFWQVFSVESIIREAVFSNLAWIAWPLILASFLLDTHEVLAFSFANLLLIFLAPQFHSHIDPRMVTGPISFLAGIASIAILSSWLMRKNQFQIRRLSQAVECSPVSIVLTDENGVIEYVNPKFTQITEFSSEESLGRNPRILKTELTPPETHIELWDTIKANKTWHGFFVNRKKSGEHFLEEAWISPITNNGGQTSSYVAVKLDITKQKELERLQEEQKRELEIYNSLMRHDLLNDIGVILGNIDIARMLIVDEEDEMLDIIMSTEAVISRMMNLLRVFGKQSEIPQTNPAILIRDIANLAQQTDRSLKIHIEVHNDAKDLRISSSRLLPMVFDNLFRNAAIHAGEEPIVKLHIRRNLDSAEIEVSDNGPGIAEEVKERLFQRGASTRNGGLGLYLSREIVNAMGGSMILIDSVAGAGATFLIRLPIRF
jgi:PAS domain S-box-containing protein